MRKSILYFLILFSSCSKGQTTKWINKEKLCDSIIIENISGNDFIFYYGKVGYVAKRENNLYKIYKDNNEVLGIIKKDSLLFINGIEYFKEQYDNVGNLNQSWKSENCFDENVDIRMAYYDYDKTIGWAIGSSYGISFSFKKININNYDIYFTYAEGGNNSTDLVDYYNKSYSKIKRVGKIIFISNKVIKVSWEGLYNIKTKKIERGIPGLQGSTEVFFMAIDE